MAFLLFVKFSQSFTLAHISFSPGQEVADAVPGVEQNIETTGGSPMELDPLSDLDALLDTIFSSRNIYGGPNLRNLGNLGFALYPFHPL